MFGLARDELATLKKLSTPRAVQDFLDALPINHEKRGETYYSPRVVLRERKAHCMEGALLAAVALWMHGRPPLLMDFRTSPIDEDHVIALYKENGYWGAISKTNHAILRFRDPVYRTPRELALSYFHEYFDFTTGEKTLREYSRPIDLSRFSTEWITSDDSVYWLAQAVDDAPHLPLMPRQNRRLLRPVGAFEIRVAEAIEWPKRDPRT